MATKSKSEPKGSATPVAEGIAAPAVATTKKRRVYIDKNYIGVKEFPANANVNAVVMQSLVAKYGAEEAKKHTIVVLKLPEDGSNVPDGFQFKGAPAQQPQAAAK